MFTPVPLIGLPPGSRSRGSQSTSGGFQMNTAKLYALVRAYENMGLSHDAAFERAFNEYKHIIKGAV